MVSQCIHESMILRGLRTYQDHSIEELFDEDRIPGDCSPDIELIARIFLLQLRNLRRTQPFVDICLEGRSHVIWSEEERVSVKLAGHNVVHLMTMDVAVSSVEGIPIISEWTLDQLCFPEGFRNCERRELFSQY